MLGLKVRATTSRLPLTLLRSQFHVHAGLLNSKAQENPLQISLLIFLFSSSLLLSFWLSFLVISFFFVCLFSDIIPYKFELFTLRTHYSHGSPLVEFPSLLCLTPFNTKHVEIWIIIFFLPLLCISYVHIHMETQYWYLEYILLAFLCLSSYFLPSSFFFLPFCYFVIEFLIRTTVCRYC